MALLVDYYRELPRPEAEDIGSPEWTKRWQGSLETFRKMVKVRYSEGTLQRLLCSQNPEARRAAVLALGQVGTMRSNPFLADKLRDEDSQVRQLAADALWGLWFRADSLANNKELQRLLRLDDSAQALAGLNSLILRAPHFAEAYNQRAILHFRHGNYPRSLTDCEKVLKLNPHHFGAQSGLAQCYMKLKKPRAALKAFQCAFRMNPALEGVKETIRLLEDAMGEEGKRDDKK
jgi:tetratricopeptide (TPR) repeat protein